MDDMGAPPMDLQHETHLRREACSGLSLHFAFRGLTSIFRRKAQLYRALRVSRPWKKNVLQHVRDL